MLLSLLVVGAFHIIIILLLLLLLLLFINVGAGNGADAVTLFTSGGALCITIAGGANVRCCCGGLGGCAIVWLFGGYATLKQFLHVLKFLTFKLQQASHKTLPQYLQ